VENPIELKERITAGLEKVLKTSIPQAEDFELADLPGWDSLKQAEFFIFLQNELRIRLSVPQMKKMTSFKNVLAVVSSLDPATSAPTSPKDKK
jgi:acyl carrier protein